MSAARWMEALPVAKQTVALQSLVMPGSHDSCSYSVQKGLGISPSESKWLKALASVFGKPVKSVIYNWSVTQTYNVYQQLSAGIRYLDLRVALRPTDGTFRIVHGLYGATLDDVMHQVKRFIVDYPKEIILLDFNHFYAMTNEDHVKFSNSIEKIFENSMRPPGKQGVQVTLKELWDNHQNVMVFYDNPDIVGQNPCFWPSSSIYSPWPNTTSTGTLLSFLDKETESHNLPKEALHVAQGLLTPNAPWLFLHLFGTLKQSLSLKATGFITTWLKKIYGDKMNHFNIIIVDFIESDNFVSDVIQWNY